MISNLWYPKEKPIQGITGWGGGATGLRMSSAGSPYTDAVWFKDASSNSTAIGLKVLELYDVSITETAWEVPAGVTNISVAVMGGGGGGYNYPALVSSQGSYACGAGELVWRNNISVTPGQILYVKGGPTAGQLARGAYSNQWGKSADITKYISDTSYNETTYTDAAVTNYSRSAYIRTWDSGSSKWLVFAEGGRSSGSDSGGNDAGYRMSQATYGSLGSEGTDWAHGGGGNGGGLASGGSPIYYSNARGSGGAGGWSGDGGHGGSGGAGLSGSGGGAGGGSKCNNHGNWYDGQGGHTFMWGEGDSGSGGSNPNGEGGQGSKTGTGASSDPPDGLGEGGGGYRDGWQNINARGPDQAGWARIVYSKDGTTRTFPSTNVGYPG